MQFTSLRMQLDGVRVQLGGMHVQLGGMHVQLGGVRVQFGRRGCAVRPHARAVWRRASTVDTLRNFLLSSTAEMLTVRLRPHRFSH